MRIPFTNRRVFETEAVHSSPPVLTGAALRAPMPVITAEMGQAIAITRELRSLAEKINRSYDAATTDNYNSDFKGTYGSANTEIFPAKYVTRARSRTLAKDTSHGKGTMRVYADNVVGDDPFDLEMEVKLPDGTDDNDTNDAIEAWSKRFRRKENFTVRKNMDFMEAMRVVEMSRVREGSVICRKYANYPFNEFGFAVDLLEEDRLQEQYQGVSGSDGRFGAGNPIRASIEYHPVYNFPVAYWILKRHPGEFYTMSVLGSSAGKSSGQNFREQVPADQIIHFNNLRNRAEQDIGMTELDATMLPLWRIHQYNKALTLSSIASATKPWWLEQREPTGFIPPSDPATVFPNAEGGIPSNGSVAGSAQDPTQSQQVTNPQNTIKPASRESLPPGYTLKQADPRFPIEAAHEFQLDNLREVSVATHGSYQQSTGDYQNLGFIAGLMSQQAFQRHMRIRQKSLIEDLRCLFKDALKASIINGYFDKRGQNILLSRLDEYVDGMKFKGQQWPFINPLVEMQTLILGAEAGHLSRQMVQDALPNGMKLEDLKKVLQQEMKDFKAAGLPFGQEEATEPGVNKEGDVTPGDEKPLPTTSDAGQPPSKSKVARPTTRHRGEIELRTLMLMDHSMNGH